jgi:hypothetical protein
VHRDDGDAVGGEVTAAPPGQHVKREPVAQSLNQNDRLRPVIEGGFAVMSATLLSAGILAGCRVLPPLLRIRLPALPVEEQAETRGQRAIKRCGAVGQQRPRRWALASGIQASAHVLPAQITHICTVAGLPGHDNTAVPIGGSGASSAPKPRNGA